MSKVKEIKVTAKEWFDEVNGNSYFSAIIEVEFKDHSRKKFKGKGYIIENMETGKWIDDPEIHLLLDIINQYRIEYKNYTVYNLPENIYFINNDLREGVKYIRFKDHKHNWKNFISKKLKELNKN